MAKAMSPREESIFVGSCDANLPDNEKTIWRFRAPTLSDERKIDSAFWLKKENKNGDMEFTASTFQQRHAALSLLLKSVDNFTDSEGKQVTPSYEAVVDRFDILQLSEPFLLSIEVGLREELCKHAMSLIKPSKADEKN